MKNSETTSTLLHILLTNRM